MPQFQYHLFKLFPLKDHTIPQVKVYSLSLENYFGHVPRLMWKTIDRDAFQNFPSHFGSQELLPVFADVIHENPYLFFLTDLPSQKTETRKNDWACIDDTITLLDKIPNYMNINITSDSALEDSLHLFWSVHSLYTIKNFFWSF